LSRFFSISQSLFVYSLSLDKYKEENWNLEVTLQELRTQLSDSQGDTLRLEGEHKRLTKLLSASRDAGDQHKNESERLKNALEDLKAKHETDVAHARKHAASLQRDKSDLQQAVDNLKTEAARSKRLPRFGSPLTPGGPANEFGTPAADIDDVFSVPASTNNRKRVDTSGMFPVGQFGELVDTSPDPSPSRPFLASNHPNNEIEALQQRLSHAQRQISTLKGTLQREKELRIGYRRKLDSPGVGLGQDEDEEEDDIGYEDVEPASGKSKLRSTPLRSGGKTRARGRSGLSLSQRLAMAPNSPSSEYNYADEGVDGDSPPPPVPPIPIKFHQPEDDRQGDVEGEDLQDEDLEQSRRSPSPSPFSDVSNRTSVDGMDPAFANVLHRSPSIGSSPYQHSPLRQSLVAGTSRGGTIGRRRGAAYQDGRPSSLIGQPGALAAELGIGMSMDSLIENELMGETKKETQEFGCQTDFEEVPPPPAVVPTPVPPAVVTAEMGVQAEPVPEPPVEEVVAAPEVVTCDGGVQTDEEPVVQHSEMAVQHEPVEEVLPVLVSTSTNTEIDVPELPVMVQAEIQTNAVDTVDVDIQTSDLSVAMVDADTQTMVSFPEVGVLPSLVEVEAEIEDARRRSRIRSMDTIRGAPISHYDMSMLSTGGASGETTITRPPARTFLAEQEDEEDDGAETETGADTETDMEDYHDAPQSVRLSTPSGSVEDFHSVITMTDNDFSESEDESIKASRTSRTNAVPPTQRRPSSYYAPKPVVTYESKEVSVEEPKAVLKDMCIQTDELTPPAPPPPVVSPGFGLFRVGSANQQFQFISPPPSAGPTSSTTSIPITVPAPSSVLRDSTATFGVRPRSAHADQRRSIESAISSVVDESPSRSRVPSGNVPVGVPSSNTLTVVDKTKPPMMALPPPPRLPPPPSSMPPPNFIPEKKNRPPPRPSSPPPPELIQRATTPIGSVLPSAKGGYARQHGSSMPPSQQNIRQLPSTSSFRSAVNAAAYASNSLASQSTLPNTFGGGDRGRHGLSTTSLTSDRSPRSSISSEHIQYQNQMQNQIRDRRDLVQPESPTSPTKAADTTVRSNNSTDPAIIHAITQTMIGEFLYKYTRRTIGKGHGERRHKRFFWVHPYTKTLYWSSADPGSSNVSESSAKSGTGPDCFALLFSLMMFWLCV
jgi:hypothetical protein